MVSVVNLKYCRDWGKPGDVYIGRKFGKYPESPFGNPFPIGNCYVDEKPEYFTRDQCIERYAKYLLDNKPVNVNGKIWDPQKIQDNLHLLYKAKRLGCWCAPERCHGDLLKYIVDHTQTSLPTDREKIYKHIKTKRCSCRK